MPAADVVTAVKDLTARATRISEARDYDAGRHTLAFVTDAHREKYEKVIRDARLNLCPRVVNNFTHLHRITGWGGADAETAQQTAETLGLNSLLKRAIRDAWLTGDGYVLVWPGQDGRDRAYKQRPEQIAFRPDEDNPSEMEWVAKAWDLRSGYGRVNLYYTTHVERYVTAAKVRTDTDEAGNGAVSWPATEHSYLPYVGDDGGDMIPNPYPVVPFAHLAHDAADVGEHGSSVLRDVIPVQNLMNAFVAHIAVTGEQYAAPLRYLLNYVPKTYLDPTTGKATQEALVFNEARQKIFGITGEGPFGQLDPPDATNLLSVIEALGQWVGRIVGIPVSDLVPDLGNVPSGAALRVLSAARSNAVIDFTDTNTPQIARLMGLLGVDAYPEWENPAPVDQAEQVEVAQAKKDLGYPLEEVLPELGEDPADIARIVGAAAGSQANIGALAMRAFDAGLDPAALTRL